VWAQQPDEFIDCATVDMNGSIVETTGECKFGMDMSYKGIWGYHPLLISSDGNTRTAAYCKLLGQPDERRRSRHRMRWRRWGRLFRLN
jgi:hypothetical protein